MTIRLTCRPVRRAPGAICRAKATDRPVILAALYLWFGGLTWMQGAFYGIGAAVIAIIGRSVWKLVKMTVAKDRLLRTIFFVSGIATASTESEVVWLFIGSGLLTMLVKAPPKLAGRAMSLSLMP